MSNPKTQIREYEGVSYLLRAPKNAKSRETDLRVLVTVHGHDGDALEYLDIVANDADTHGLVVVAPQFPREADAPTSNMHGGNFDFPESDAHAWLHRLLHNHLPTVLAGDPYYLTVSTDKVYFFGHSKGGQFIHIYMLTHSSCDVLRAAICGPGHLRRYSHHRLRNIMPTAEYRPKLRALAQANVAIIVGTSDCANDGCLTNSAMGHAWDPQNLCPAAPEKQPEYKWRRIQEAIDYFNIELAQLLGEAYMKSIIQQEPPEWHPPGAYFPIPTGPATDPVTNPRICFYWTPNAPDAQGNPVNGHRGWRNYVIARQYLFGSEAKVGTETKVACYAWSRGWTTTEFFTVESSTYLFLLKSGDGTVHTHRMNTDGTVGQRVETFKWSSGWTTAEFYTINGNTYLFLLKSGDGTVHTHRMNMDGTVGQRVETFKWSSGWTTAEFYTINGNTYLFLLKSVDGTVHTHRMNMDGTVGQRVETFKWSSGWTTAEFYTINGNTYLFLLKSVDGTVHTHRMNMNGTLGQRVETFKWSSGWTIAEFYTINANIYLFLLKSGDGTVHTHRMNANGVVGNLVSNPGKDLDWQAGWTAARFYMTGMNNFLFLLSEASGLVNVQKLL